MILRSSGTITRPSPPGQPARVFSDQASEQREHLERVATKLSVAVLEFCAGRETFHASELAAHVAERVPNSSPDSASRILRLLKRDGALSYVVENRRASLYRVLPVARPKPAPRLEASGQAILALDSRATVGAAHSGTSPTFQTQCSTTVSAP